ncbi:hypothetical protein S40293_11421 [Stachybotrys chartarum IBT 40293]|nr:hypothetical protein S40293_11421 [Stachybotrys chartarum IBT 40293]
MVSSPTEQNTLSPAPDMDSQLDGSAIFGEVPEIFDGDALLMLRNTRYLMKARSVLEMFKYKVKIHRPGKDGRVWIGFIPQQFGLANIKLRVQYIREHDTSAPSMNSTPPRPRRQSHDANNAFCRRRSNGSPDLGETRHLKIDTTEPQKDGHTPPGSPRKRALSPDATGAARKRQKK